MNRIQRKWRKLRQRPAEFLHDMRSPVLRVLAWPCVWLLALIFGNVLWRARSRKSFAFDGNADERTGDRKKINFVAHLLKPRFRPFARGTVSLPWRLRAANKYIPEMLDFARCVAPLDQRDKAKGIDVYCTWGVTDNVTHDLAREMSHVMRKPLLSLEYGFISSFDIALRGGPQLSIVISDGVMYYDSTQPSLMENRLNGDELELSDNERERARRCIELIVTKKVTKYNHAPELDLRDRLMPSVKQRVLLVDQRFGDQSIVKGLADMESFERMFAEACALPDCEVLAKVHPDAISGGMESYLGKILAREHPANVTLIDFDVNPFSIFEVVDKVFVATSQAGFEALLAGKEVHCFGVPFYAGWGLTFDRVAVPRRTKSRTLEEVFHVAYFECSRYYVPGLGIAELETLVSYIAALRWYAPRVKQREKPVEIVGPPPEGNLRLRPQKAPAVRNGIRVIIVIPSGRFGATGRTTQDLAWHLNRVGCVVLVLCEGSCKPEYAGVQWDRIEFEGMRLSARLRKRIQAFNPDVVYENGVRSRAQRAALEIVLSTSARLALHSEDDDVQVYMRRHPSPDPHSLTLLDAPEVNLEMVTEFLKRNDWGHTLTVLGDPSFDRWVEPLLRIMCYRLAQLHTTIWYPFAERLQRDFGVDAVVVPPVTPIKSLEPHRFTPDDRRLALENIRVDPESFVFFVAGTIYDYSDEYLVFLEAMRRAQSASEQNLSLVLLSGRTQLEVGDEALARLDPRTRVVDLGAPDDSIYLATLKASDVICAPGVPDDFNRYRLASRLVKAMAFQKAILTYRCGFGESLIHGYNAFLTQTADPSEWAGVMLSCLDRERLAEVGANARTFAEEHFDAAPVACMLADKFKELRKTPGVLETPWQPPVAEPAPEVLETGSVFSAVVSSEARLR